MGPSDEVQDFDTTMRVRRLRADFWCAREQLELSAYNATIAIRRLGAALQGALLRWQLEQRDAWIVAQRDPEAWLDRLVLG